MNLPNKITLIRIILIPIMVFLYLATFIPYGKLIALAVFILAACTDFIDGMIARKYGLVTNLGKFLDPIADKLLTASALLLVVCDMTLPPPYGVIIAIIILGRELIISAFRQVAATKNFVMAADKWGKIKTIFQDIALPALFFLSLIYQYSWFSESFVNVYEIICHLLILIATILTIISGINYLVKNWAVLKTDKNDVAVKEVSNKEDIRKDSKEDKGEENGR